MLVIVDLVILRFHCTGSLYHLKCSVGMNTVIVLLMLLLAVPLQLFLSHYINTAYSDAESVDSGPENSKGDINSVRTEAVHRYGLSVIWARYVLVL